MMKKKNVIFTGLGFVFVTYLFFYLPLPSYIESFVQIEPRDAHRVYVQQSGTLTDIHVEFGSKVNAGEPLLDLQEYSLLAEIKDLESQRNELLAQIESLEQSRFNDSTVTEKINLLKNTVMITHEKFLRREKDYQQLSVSSSVSGIILPVSKRKLNLDEDTLNNWSGQPLDTENLGCYLESGTIVCVIGDPLKSEAILIIDETEMDRIAIDQEVEILIDATQEIRYSGKITELSKVNMEHLPEALSNISSGPLSASANKQGVHQPNRTYYRAKVPLPDLEQPLQIGLLGRARIKVSPITLATRVSDFLHETFHFQL